MTGLEAPPFTGGPMLRRERSPFGVARCLHRGGRPGLRRGARRTQPALPGVASLDMQAPAWYGRVRVKVTITISEGGDDGEDGIGHSGGWRWARWLARHRRPPRDFRPSTAPGFPRAGRPPGSTRDAPLPPAFGPARGMGGHGP